MIAKIINLAEARGWKALEKALKRDQYLESVTKTNNPVYFADKYDAGNKAIGRGMELVAVAKPKSQSEGIPTFWRDLFREDMPGFHVADAFKGNRKGGGVVSQNQRAMQIYGPTNDEYWKIRERRGLSADPSKWTPENLREGHTRTDRTLSELMLDFTVNRREKPSIFFADGTTL